MIQPAPPKLEVHRFPCLSDNYGFLLHDPESRETACIDTPDAQKYLSEAKARGWIITQIWNTHWHQDHAGGNAEIIAQTGAKVVGPKEIDRIGPGPDRQVAEGDEVKLGRHLACVLETPGHTLGHITYHLPEAHIAFVGDTLFALGCGRMFEGNPPMFWNSLSKIAALPADTAVYCAHEYTASNAAFAVSVDPGNEALQRYAAEVKDKRARDIPTVPTTIGAELASNPFLRADKPAMQAAMGHPGDPAATFGEIRKRKDAFKG
jgi:hydroxyacylglutathione hydrolase